MTKICFLCKREKDISEFYRNRSKNDGYHTVCKSCIKIYNSKNRKKWDKKYHILNKDKRTRYSKEWLNKYRIKNRDKCNKIQRDKYAENPERVKAYVNKWRDLNPGKVLAMGEAHRSRQLQAMPYWIDPEEIIQIYKMAVEVSKKTGVPHEVDHIIPLQHPLVCGLHVPWNLRIITKEENRRKSNKFSLEEENNI